MTCLTPAWKDRSCWHRRTKGMLQSTLGTSERSSTTMQIGSWGEKLIAKFADNIQSALTNPEEVILRVSDA